MAFTSNNTFLPWDPLRAVKETPCAACGKPEVRLFKCGACKFAKYCSEECQRSVWTQHQPVCKSGYTGYIARLEERQQRLGKMFELGGNHDSVMALYDEALGEARAFGDAEGVRHVLRVMAHRCDAIGRDQDAARHTAEADKIEQVIGKPISAKHVFNQVDGGRTAQPILEKLAAPRGSKTGSLPWCRWEQSIADVTLSVPLPADVRKAALSIAFSKQRVRISLTGGVVIADCVLCAPIKPDECSWTLSDGTACIMLEKVERKVWDWLEPEPPAHKASTTAASAAAALDVTDPSPAAASPAAAARPAFGLAAEAPLDRLVDAVIACDLAPPRPPPLSSRLLEEEGGGGPMGRPT